MQDYYGGNYANGNNNNAANYDYYGGGNGANYENGNGYYNNEQRENYEGMYQQKLVHFKLCPSDSCWRCKNGADYVVTLSDFVDAMLEAKMSAEEYECEQVRERCYCENANSQESCLYNCFKNAGKTNCANAMYEQEFDLQEAVECVQLEVEDEDAVKNYIYAHTDQSQLRDAYWAQQQGEGGNYQQDMGEVDGDLYVGPCK